MTDNVCLVIGAGHATGGAVAKRFACAGLESPRLLRRNHRFVGPFFANFLPGDEGNVHGEARIVDGYSGKALQIATTCTFQKG